ncbi:hypothetical protein M5K25_007412 [Dendrobium thyrsiflorum]|uniref:Uncharacterized protein n=1 Tax=Dendrobium thyrsiflorum TaxID=117978 RepID=A0ABD0VEA8_DENTH
MVVSNSAAHPCGQVVTAASSAQCRQRQPGQVGAGSGISSAHRRQWQLQPEPERDIDSDSFSQTRREVQDATRGDGAGHNFFQI